MNKELVAGELVKIAKSLTADVSPDGIPYQWKYVDISQIGVGDIIIHDGEMRTVGREDIGGDTFMGESLFGDSYHSGQKKVKKVTVVGSRKISSELAKTAKSLTANSSLLDPLFTDRDVANLKGIVDDQTYELAVEVYSTLREAFEPKGSQNEAINRLRQSVLRGGGMQADQHRNNIFKAAHALGIRLPSSMF